MPSLFVNIEVPELTKRVDDVKLLVRHFIDELQLNGNSAFPTPGLPTREKLDELTSGHVQRILAELDEVISEAKLALEALLLEFRSLETRVGPGGIQ